MNDAELGKRISEEMVLEQLLGSFPTITGRKVTEEAESNPPDWNGLSPDFVIGLDGRAFGIELTEIRDAGDAWDYLAKASGQAWKKHKSYERRGLFTFPIALVFHAIEPPLYDIQQFLDGSDEFQELGFAEVWAVDFSDAYYSPQDPRRPADMFCFKPQEWLGFHRIGWWGRKPFG